MNQTAYKIIPAFQNLNIVPDGAQITCMTCNESCVYVGTDDGLVLRFTYEELSDETRQKYYFYDKTMVRSVVQRKKVASIKLSIVYSCLIVLCDENLVFMKEDSLELIPSLKLRGVTCFHVREGAARDETLSCHVCAGMKKKVVQLYAIVEDKLQHLCEVSVPGIPAALNFDGSLMCAGLNDRYYITEFDKNEGQQLFDFDPSQLRPMVLHVAKGEFVLNGPNGLGISTSYGGESKRPPILLNNYMVDMVMQNPFIIALNDEFITVHSTLLGCEQKQSIPFVDGRCLTFTASRVFAASSKQLFALIPVPWSDQASELLEHGEVEAALELCEIARMREKDTTRFQEAYHLVLQQAGFVQFVRMKFKEARKMFDVGQLDLPELIRLYPDLLPSDGSVVIQSLHNGIPSVDGLTNGGLDQAKSRKYKEFLSEFLVEHRESELGRPYRRIVDIALLKLYAEVRRPEELEVLLMLCDVATSDVFDISNHLILNGRHHAAAVLLKHHQMYADATDIWRKLADGEVSDPAFPGLHFVMSYLKDLPDEDILGRQASWIIEKDPDKAVEIFIEHGDSPVKALSPDVLLERLTEFSRPCLTYLEFLINTKNSQSERFHTQLAGLYIELCSEESGNQPRGGFNDSPLRDRCRRFLQHSDHYRVQFVLGKLQDTTLKVETAIVYGKLGEHDRALRILARELGEYEEARRYCVHYGTKMKARHKLFETLLAIYLDDSNAESDMLIGPAIELLNNPDSVFDSAQVLRQLPDSWGISILSQFLNSSLRTSMHRRRQVVVRRGLYESEVRRMADQATSGRRHRFDLDIGSKCPACGEGFTDVDCALTPQLGLVHTHCAQL